MKQVKLILTLDQAQDLDLLLYDSILRYEEADDTEARSYKIHKQIQGRLNTALKKHLTQ